MPNARCKGKVCRVNGDQFERFLLKVVCGTVSSGSGSGGRFTETDGPAGLAGVPSSLEQRCRTATACIMCLPVRGR